MKKEVRESGVLLPVSSLPSPYGIGTMGESAYRFVDFLKAAGQSWWQILPLTPTGYGDSPYASFSTFAGNPYLIDLDRLAEAGLLEKAELAGIDWGHDPERVDYGKMFENRFRVLREAFERGRERLAGELAAFRAENASWLEDYALFMAVKNHFDLRPWPEWPDEGIRLHRPEAVKVWREKLAEEVDYYAFMQYLFFSQWKDLRAYAHEQGIRFIGDIPIYVALDSSDVWSSPSFFQLDEKNIPVEVAGVPPDDFTDDGQLWGNPLYDWDAMKADGFGWWIRRVEGAGRLYDMIRIDHFRGFESYWAVPNGQTTAKIGRWRPGPGMDLVGVLTSWFPHLKFIAEDLGYTTPEVEKLLADSGLPGMKVLEFGFDPDGDADYCPHNCTPNSVCYIGTHDNETVNGWVANGAGMDFLKFAADYMHITPEEGWCWGMIRTGMATQSRLFVVQMQDLLELGPDARVNTPGRADGNWQWRMKPGAATADLAERLHGVTELYRRLPAAEWEEISAARRKVKAEKRAAEKAAREAEKEN
ncbi:MAG: 4-alpha-glucanotransferase [Lachnospiraceae bacterium]|nr:4-alpha-glucanotransferase [Lachnospiraceae bacterium]